MIETFTCTHKQAVTRAGLWLRNNRGCAVVATERRVNGVSEQPDAVGWRGNGESYLVECKVSRADFLADREKAFRRAEESGVGDLRYFAAPIGLLKPEDIPDGWGLLQIDKGKVWHTKPAEPKPANRGAEAVMLVSMIRRLEMAATVFVCHEEAQQESGHE